MSTASDLLRLAITGARIPGDPFLASAEFLVQVYSMWAEASKRRSSPVQARPTQSVPRLLRAIAEDSPAATPSWSRPPGASGPVRPVASETQAHAEIERRAAEIARSPNTGSDFDNWLRAVIELRIAQRAREIARSPNAGGDLENWLRAEREFSGL
jgi:hypothetical protein